MAKLEQPTWLSVESVSVKINGVNKPAMGEYTGEYTGSSLPTLLQITYGTIFWAQSVPLPAESMLLKRGFTAMKDCSWREELCFKEASQ